MTNNTIHSCSQCEKKIQNIRNWPIQHTQDNLNKIMELLTRDNFICNTQYSYASFKTSVQA